MYDESKKKDIIVPSSELYHYGILGQKWGVRRFQNPDGSLTDEGKQRYYDYKSVDNKPEYLRTNSDRKIENRYAQARLWINDKKYRQHLGISNERYKEIKRKVTKMISEANRRINFKTEYQYHNELQNRLYKDKEFIEISNYIHSFDNVPYSEVITNLIDL